MNDNNSWNSITPNGLNQTTCTIDHSCPKKALLPCCPQQCKHCMQKQHGCLENELVIRDVQCESTTDSKHTAKTVQLF